MTGFFHEGTSSIAHVCADPETRCCAVIDPVLDFDRNARATSTECADRMLGFVRERALEVEWILDTHPHADHLSAAPHLKERLGPPLQSEPVSSRCSVSGRRSTTCRIFPLAVHSGTVCSRVASGSRWAGWRRRSCSRRAARHSIHVHDGVTEAEFLRRRRKRDVGLPLPALMLEALQVNMRGGRLPEPEANGVSYLKIPLNRFPPWRKPAD
ncbi:MBL fold metallo-hydrolase [Falsiroseomonas sp. HC035]|uniref:MBL fold metallo-hydrolase n=1 Tax=Falsiroseomonas sp. HC035 TaxID=3390999 RepID=UPI003D31D71E